MTKNESTAKENKNKRSENRYQARDFEALFEMISRFCEGRRGTPYCCSGMMKMWKEIQDKSKEDPKQK